MDLAETIKGAVGPLLEATLAPMTGEVQRLAGEIEKLREEVASLHMLVARGVSPMVEGNRSFDGAVGRKSLPGGPRLTVVSEQQPRLRPEEAKLHRKADSAPKVSDAKRKSDEIAAKREEDKTNREKAKKDAEAKKTDEEAKKKEGKAGKMRPGSGQKAEEVKKKPIVRRQSEDKKRVEKPDDGDLTGDGTQQTEESDRSPVAIDPSFLASIDSAPIHPPSIVADIPTPVLLPADPLCASIDQELQQLLSTYGEQTLIVMAPFQLSLGARSALSLLNTMEDSQLYLASIPSREEVFWVFRLFFQLCGDTLSDDKNEAWGVCRVFIAAGKATGLEERIAEAANGFDFSNDNLDVVDSLLAGKTDRINPSLYNTFCTLSGLMMFPIKEALAYAGLLPDKVQPWRKYQRLLHKRKRGKQ